MMLSAFLFAAQNCGDDEKALTEDDVNEEIVTSCHGCHSEDSEIGMKILAAQAGYDNSGHKNGPRGWIELTDVNGNVVLETLFHGSNAQYSNGTPCSECHTHNGFIDRFTEEGAGNYGAPAPIGCFTCHQPHKNGNFNLRNTEAVTLKIDKTGATLFDRGKGNLCVNCHQSRTASSSVNSTFPGTPSSHWGPHHGPQGDFLMGANGYEFTGETYSSNDVHYDAADNSPADACVTCHRYTNDKRYGSNLETGNHGMYLTANVHGNMTDRVDLCLDNCHSAIKDTSGTSFAKLDKAAADWDGDGTAEKYLEEVQGLADLLYGYFATASNFAVTGGTCTTAPVEGPAYIAGTNDGISTQWRLTWDFGSLSTADDTAKINNASGITSTATTIDYDGLKTGAAAFAANDIIWVGGEQMLVTAATTTVLTVTRAQNGTTAADYDDDATIYRIGTGGVLTADHCTLTKAQGGAWFNFKYYTEDHSGGVHFPKYAAQLLYTSLKAVGVTVGATAP